DVRDDPIGVDPDAADLGEPFRERFRIAVVVTQTVAHLLESDERGGRDDTRLSHRPAQELSDPARLGDRLGATAAARTDARRQALREAELDRVDGCAQLARIDP